MSTFLPRLALLLLAVAPAANAYEDDIHYGLTNWLARRAGFDTKQAHLIAKANVDYDHSSLAAVNLVKHSACYGRDPTVSREVRKIHFPSEAQLPSDPADRKVDAGSDAARSAYLKVLAIPASSQEENLIALGQALHPLQDSWSHQGIPGSPLPLVCDKNLSWGHPATRGGWRSHQADIAHFYVNDAMAMAEASYGALCAARNKLHSAPCTHDFNRISGEVLKLVRLNNKAAKAAWFKTQQFSEVAFLDTINIPDGDGKARHEAIDYATESLAPLRKSNESALPKSPEATFMREFFHRWMTEKDVSQVVKEYLALEAYRSTLGNGEPRRVMFAAAQAHLQFWRVRDHGLLQQNLEGNHDLIMSDLQSIPGVVQQGDQPYASLTDALLPLDESGLPIVTWTTQRPDGTVLWVGAVRLRHAPHELVIVVAERIGGRPQVVSINSVVTE